MKEAIRLRSQTRGIWSTYTHPTLEAKKASTYTVLTLCVVWTKVGKEVKFKGTNPQV